MIAAARLRAIAGIWPYGKGRIEIPDTAREVIMPETPYLPVGTLRQALTYSQVDARIADDDQQWHPRQIGSSQHDGLAERDGEAAYSRTPIGAEGSGLPTDADLQRALALCGVAHLASRLDEEHNWAQQLFLNDQKRLAFARLLLRRPDLIFLDETTSDLDDESAIDLYRILREELPAPAWSPSDTRARCSSCTTPNSSCGDAESGLRNRAAPSAGKSTRVESRA